MTDTTRNSELQALTAVLDTYGGDSHRWPAEQQRRFAQLIDRDAAAARLVAEAAALDRLLDRAPLIGAKHEREIAQRIVASAAASADAGHEPQVIDLEAARARRQPAVVARPPRWRTAAVLAASLLIGVLAGRAGVLDILYPDGDTDGQIIALSDEPSGLTDEDLL